MGDEETGDASSTQVGTGVLEGTEGTGSNSAGTEPVPYPASDPFSEQSAGGASTGPDGLESLYTTTLGQDSAQLLESLSEELAQTQKLNDESRAALDNYAANYLADTQGYLASASASDAITLATDIANTLGNDNIPQDAVTASVTDLLSGLSGYFPDPNQTGQHAVADPIAAFSGQLVQEADDLQIDGAGINFVFHRTYKNQVLYAGPIGANWNHSYNIHLREGDDVVWLMTGDLREEAYTRHPDFGTDEFTYFVPPNGVHAVILPSGDSFVQRLADGTTYIFERTPGGLGNRHRLHRIEDRNANFLEFIYENDLLDHILVNHQLRVVTLTYDDFDRVIAISDWMGRSWQYAYDELNNLTAVTSPATNQYSAGLTTQYEYEYFATSGPLQHNLVRIIDPEGREYLSNDFGRNANTKSFNAVVRQRQGGGEATFEYESVDEEFDEPYTESQLPAAQTTFIDRNGLASHFVYNAAGNLLLNEVIVVEGDHLRHIAWRYRYNRDGALTASLSPEGILTQYLYGRDSFLHTHDIEDADVPTNPDLTISARLSFGRLLAVVRRNKRFGLGEFDLSGGVWGPVFPSIFGDLDPLDVAVKYSYEPVYGQLSTASDPRFTQSADPQFPEEIAYQSSLTRYEYTGPTGDSTRSLAKIVHPTPIAPDGTHLGPVIDEFTDRDPFGRVLEQVDPVGTVTRFSYFAPTDGRLEGHLHKVVVDPDGLALTTVYERDQVGRIIAIHSPRAVDGPPASFVTQQLFNDLDQLVQTTTALPSGFVKRYFYDSAGHVNRVERTATDENGVDVPNAPEVHTAQFDSQGNLLRETIGGTDNQGHLVTRHVYDPSDQRILTILPAGNRVRRYYSERMLPTYVTYGEQTNDVSTTRISYNGDGQMRERVSALGSRWSWTLSSFGEATSIRDPVSNELRRTYDKAGNILIERMFERQADGKFTLMSRTEAEYDVLQRVIRLASNLFEDPIPVVDLESDFRDSPGPGRLLTVQLFRDANGHVTRVVDPMGRAKQTQYDAAGRLEASTDAIETRIQIKYDDEGNVVRTDREELVHDEALGLVLGKEVFSNTAIYDELNRQVSTTDALGNVSSTLYDSRNQPATRIDPLGNVQRMSYDIYGRRLSHTVELTDTGIDTGLQLEPEITGYRYDANGNLSHVIDGLGRTTIQQFDSLDRRRQVTYPDLSTMRTEYNRDSQVLSTRDANGTTCSYKSDALGRVTRVDVDTSGVQPGLTVEGFSFATFDFDALGRLRRCENDFETREITLNSVGFALAEQLTDHTLAGPTTAPLILKRTFNDAGARTSLRYTNGRVLSFNRDDNDQLTGIVMQDAGHGYPGLANQMLPALIANLRYTGSRCIKVDYGNAAGSSIAYDGAGRKIQILHRRNQQSFASLQQLWDASGSVRFRNDLLAGITSGERYSYDSSNRLTEVEQSAGIAPFNPAVLGPSTMRAAEPLPNRQADIDAVIAAPAPTSATSLLKYDLVGNRLEEVFDGQPPLLYEVNTVNEYQSVGGDIPTYDSAGNMTGDGALEYRYDALNRLVRVFDRGSGADVARFSHDSIGRRVLVLNGVTSRFLVSDGPNIIEEYSAGVLSAQFIHAEAPDTPLQIAAEGTEHWYHIDGTRSVRFITDSVGTVGATYSYSPFGISKNGTTPYNPLRFASRPLDGAIESYDFRSRQYDPKRGRFLQRDSKGAGDATNLYTFADNNPVSAIDPMGTDPSSAAGDPLSFPTRQTFSNSLSAFDDSTFSSLVQSGKGNNEATIPVGDDFGSDLLPLAPAATTYIMDPIEIIGHRPLAISNSNSAAIALPPLDLSQPTNVDRFGDWTSGAVATPIGISGLQIPTDDPKPSDVTTQLACYLFARTADLMSVGIEGLTRTSPIGIGASLITGTLGLVGLGSGKTAKIIGHAGAYINLLITAGAVLTSGGLLPVLSLTFSLYGVLSDSEEPPFPSTPDWIGRAALRPYGGSY